MKQLSPTDSKISSLPFDRLESEAASQKNRVVTEVMNLLFEKLPDETSQNPDFTLADGTQCWIKKFHSPKIDENGEWRYGFDVKFKESPALSHLEFTVSCSGWERVLTAPTPR